LLRSHANFRAVSQILLERLEALMEIKEPTPWSRQRTLRFNFDLYRRWIGGMRSHEGYEEHKLYPYLAQRFGLSTNRLSEDHEEMHRLDDTIRTAWQTAIDDKTPETALPALLDALRAHDVHLDAHLIDEEDAVIPPLLSLPREEFARYYESNIRTLLTQSAACACA
jgi:hypothetical protein